MNDFFRKNTMPFLCGATSPNTYWLGMNEPEWHDEKPIEDGDVWEIPDNIVYVRKDGRWVKDWTDKFWNIRMTCPPPEMVGAYRRQVELGELRIAGVIL